MESSDGPAAAARTRFESVTTVLLIVMALCSILAVLSPSESVRRHHDMWYRHHGAWKTTTVSPVPTWFLPDLGMEYPIVAANAASLSANQTEAMILKALSLGITNIDVHLGGSERDGLASALRRVDREEMFIVTKIDKPPANLTDPAAAAQVCRFLNKWPHFLFIMYIETD